MPDRTFLGWPFFDQAHRDFARDLDAWAAGTVRDSGHGETDVDAACRGLVRALGEAGWLAHATPAGDRPLDVRTLCLARETLARHNGLADFAFAMQGLGAGPLSLFGTAAQKERYLGRVARGEAIAAFALSELEAGSDVAAMTMAAAPVSGGYRLNGAKTWISNGGIADFYTVFARTGEPGSKGITAFVVDADAPGLTIAERIEIIAPHPLATIRFDDCVIPAAQRIGAEGAGMKIALATLDIFRSTVGAAALGFARRALDEALERATGRRLFGAPLAQLQMIQAKIADMALAIDAAALLVYRAAWTADVERRRVTREAAMAKLFATEEAQRVIDEAVQIFGGLGVRRGHIVESLYREIRALRIYEGASEVQRLVIARQTLGG
jgi:alkylation response protein AidB-like acyl-CoA dehydrogenase